MSKTQKEYNYRTYCKKKRQNITNSPTAAQLSRLGTPDPPLRVQPRDLYLGMQTKGHRCDRASLQRKNKEIME